MTAPSGALGGIRVLDTSAGVAGQFCGRMLADYGATVTLLEPREGAATRRVGPFRADGSSLLFFHLNHGKSLDGLSGMLGRAGTADVVITDDAELGDAVAASCPTCVVCIVTPFGSDGPLADWRGDEMMFQALSGIMHNNGEYGRKPLYGVGHRASYAAGVAAYNGVLAALIARERHGQGQFVRIDITETAASMCFPYAMQYIYNDTIRRRNDQKQPICPVECRDGWVCIWIYPHLFARACTLLGLPELIADPRFQDTLTRQHNWSEFVAIINRHLRDRGAEDLVAELQAHGIIAAKTYRLTELLASGHLRQRGYWETVETADGPRVVLGPQFRFSATPRQMQGATAAQPGVVA